MQESVDELGSENIQGVTPVLKDSEERFVLLFVPALFLFCPVPHRNCTSNPWNKENKSIFSHF